jgi:hypothetical protein
MRESEMEDKRELSQPLKNKIQFFSVCYYNAEEVINK